MENQNEPEEAPTAEPERPVRRHRGTAARTHHRTTVGRASFLLLALFVLQIFTGVLLGNKANQEALAAHRHLAEFADDEELDLEGQTMTAGALRKQIDREKLQAWVLPVGLGVVFLALFFWAQKSPLPAFGTALGLYVMAIAVTAVIDPSTLAKGIVVKVLCTLGLLGGLKSALALRSIESANAPTA